MDASFTGLPTAGRLEMAASLGLLARGYQCVRTRVHAFPRHMRCFNNVIAGSLPQQQDEHFQAFFRSHL